MNFARLRAILLQFNVTGSDWSPHKNFEMRDESLLIVVKNGFEEWTFTEDGARDAAKELEEISPYAQYSTVAEILYTNSI